MSIVFNNNTGLTYQQWQTLSDSQKAVLASAMGYGNNVQFVDTALSAGEKLQPGINQPSGSGVATTTTEPNLIPPDWSLVAAGGLGLTLATDLLAVIGYNFSETLASLFTGTVREDELAYIKEAIAEVQKEGVSGAETPPPSADNPPVAGPTTTFITGSSLAKIWDNIQNSIKEGTVTIPEGYQQIAENMSSQDPQAVRAALSQIINLDKYNLTPEQKTLVESKLDKLASNIASSVAGGGSPAFFIRLGIPELLALQFGTSIGLDTDTSLSDADKELFQTIFMDAGKNLSGVNFAYASSVKPPSPEYAQLTSQNTTQLTTLMTTLFNAMALPEGVMTETERSQVIAALAAEVGGGPLPTELTSSNEQEVSDYLIALFEKLAKEGKIPGDTASMAKFTMYIVPALGQKIAAINKGKYLNDLYSPDSSLIDGALRKLESLPPSPDLKAINNLPPDEIAQKYGTNLVLESYLKVLVKALSFLAQIRCLISSMEGKFSQELARAKQAGIADQVKASNATYQAEIKKIQAETGAQLKQIHKAALMKWLMPFITIITAIIATIITIVVTVFTAGAAAAPALAASALLINAVVIALSVTTCVLTVVDAVLNMCGKKGTMEMLAEAILESISPENQPAWAKALINAIIQLVITLVVAIFTFGTGLIVSGIKLSMTAFDNIIQALTGPCARAAISLVFTVTIQPLLSSGLLLQTIKLIVDQVCKNDELKSTIISAVIMMIITILIMVLMIVAGKAVGGAGQAAKGVSAGTAAATGATGNAFTTFIKTASQRVIEFLRYLKASIPEPVLNMLQRLITAIGRAFSPITKAVSTAATAAAGAVTSAAALVAGLVDKLAKVIPACMKEAMTGPGFVRLLDSATKLLTIATNIIVATTAFEKARYQKEIARLEKEIAELESTLSMMESMGSSALDQSATLKNLTKDAENRAEDWAAIVNLVASYITEASKNLNTLVTQGAAR